MEAVQQALADRGAELRDELWEDGVKYVSVPVGDAEAVEVEIAYTQDEHRTPYFAIVYRAWDGTHGVSAEDELDIEPTASLAIKTTLAHLDRIARDQADLIALLDAASEEGQ